MPIILKHRERARRRLGPGRRARPATSASIARRSRAARLTSCEPPRTTVAICEGASRVCASSPAASGAALGRRPGADDGESQRWALLAIPARRLAARDRARRRAARAAPRAYALDVLMGEARTDGRRRLLRAGRRVRPATTEATPAPSTSRARERRGCRPSSRTCSGSSGPPWCRTSPTPPRRAIAARTPSTSTARRSSARSTAASTG